jgi:phosphatidylglycerophosphate synthase/putative flippase GtrA
MQDALVALLSGDAMSPALRVWSALAPAILLSAYMVGGLFIYLRRARKHQVELDPETVTRGGSAILSVHVRSYFAWVTRPVWWAVKRSELPPSAITVLSVFFAIGAGVAAAAGRFALAGWLYALAGACDFLDGRLARHQGNSSRQGAALDSILDRYGEGAVLIGLAWFYRDTWVLLPVLLTLTGGMLVSYVRAKGEGFGVEIKSGLFQRPERTVILALAMALAPVVAALRAPFDPAPMHWLVVGALVLLAVGTQVTAMGRLVRLLTALGTNPLAGVAGTRKGSLWRGGITSGVATVTDLGAVILMVSLLGMPAWISTALGCGLGAVVSFSLGRNWAFHSNDGALSQARRYAVASVSSAVLNAGGVALLLLLPMHYLVAWGLVRALVFVLWNYPLHREYVFAAPSGA